MTCGNFSISCHQSHFSRLRMMNEVIMMLSHKKRYHSLTWLGLHNFTPVDWHIISRTTSFHIRPVQFVTWLASYTAHVWLPLSPSFCRPKVTVKQKMNGVLLAVTMHGFGSMIQSGDQSCAGRNSEVKYWDCCKILTLPLSCTKYWVSLQSVSWETFITSLFSGKHGVFAITFQIKALPNPSQTSNLILFEAITLTDWNNAFHFQSYIISVTDHGFLQ